MRSFCLAFCAIFALGMVPSASFATNGNDQEQGQGQDQAQGQGQEQGQAQAQGQVAVGGNASQTYDGEFNGTLTNETYQGYEGEISGNFSGNTTSVNENLDSDDFRKHAESAPRVEGSESGCHTGVSAQGGGFGGSLGGASAACDAINGIRAIHLAESQDETVIANLVRANVVVRSFARMFLSFATLGLL